MDIQTFEKKAIESTLFTAPVIAQDLSSFLETKTRLIKDLARQASEEKVSHIYWVGAGNSRVNLMSGKELMDRFTDIPSDCFYSYEFIWRNPERLDKNAWVFLASFSGATEDTVEAARFARSKGAKTIAFVNQADSLIGREADTVIDYCSKALFILPLAGAYIFVLELARLQGKNEAVQILEEIEKLPGILDKQYRNDKTSALKLAEEFKDQNMIYTLGCAPLAGLAYKFGLTVFMENMRVNGSYIETTEFRHGPAEMLDRQKPAFVFLIADDPSRALTERVIELVKGSNSPHIIYDTRCYPKVDPWLAPFILMIPLQWFAVYSAYFRGIYDLDQRVFMGHGMLSQGQGVTWP
jgi:fructoselysine 6-phosphate deglycase